MTSANRAGGGNAQSVHVQASMELVISPLSENIGIGCGPYRLLAPMLLHTSDVHLYGLLQWSIINPSCCAGAIKASFTRPALSFSNLNPINLSTLSAFSIKNFAYVKDWLSNRVA